MIVSSSKKNEFLGAHRAADDDFYRFAYPVYALSAIEEGVVRPFDVLIVDEGQDLISPDYLDVFDLLLQGGLNTGRWTMFCDFARQAIFSDRAAEEMLAELDRRVTRFVRFLLTVNCRNTQPIGEETALISGFEAPPVLLAHVQGPPVDYRFYSGKDQERDQLREIVSELLKQKLSPSVITILSPVSREKSCISAPMPGIPPIEDVSDSNVPGGSKKLTFSTIQAFKGLENSVIILTDIVDLSSPASRSLLYVGMSRARQRLFLLVDQESREQYKSAIQRRIMRLSHGHKSTNH
jgi:superfamily I DNA/RNA helicase